MTTSKLQLPTDLSFVPGGWIGERLRALVDNWLVPAPVLNEGMVEMFAHRDDPAYNQNVFPWVGEFAGKYLIGAVQALRMGDDPALGFAVARVANRLIEIQRNQLAAGRDASLSMPLPWDLWGQYHVLLGLLGWHRYSGSPEALRACLVAADRTCARYLNRAWAIADDHRGDDEKNHAVAHVLALLYEITGTQQYLDLAQQIETEWRTDRCYDPAPGGTPGQWVSVRCGDFVRNALDGRDFFTGSRRRWESLHDVQLIGELHLITGDPDRLAALTQIWQSLLAKDVNPSGGISASEFMTGNRFDPHYVETCATVAWMALSVDVLRSTADSTVADQLEISLFNAVLGAGSPDGRHWTYHTPVGGQAIEQTWTFPSGMREAVHVGYRLPAQLDLANQAQPRYPQLSCCAANGPRGIGCLADWAVLRSTGEVLVNFYGPGAARFTDPQAGDLQIIQETDYPIGNTVRLRVSPLAGAADLTLAVRIPFWSHATEVTVNGEPVPASAGSYCRIARRWVANDMLVIRFDFAIRRQLGAAEASGLATYHRGPLLLAADSQFGWTLPELPAVRSVGRGRDRIDPDPPDVTAAGGPPLVTAAKVLVPAHTSAGPLLLCDFASAGQSPSGALAARPDTNGSWQFGRRDGSVIAARLFLRPEGSIAGHSHPNETRWGFDGDVLTFFGADGAPTTRFSGRIRRNGLQVLLGTFLPDLRIRHVLAQLAPGLEKPWLFSRADGPAESSGTVLKRRVRLLAGGGFDQDMHPNESSWGRIGDAPAFFGPTGQPTTIFDQAEVYNGRMRYRGTFLLNPGITHVLDELPADLAGTIWGFDRIPGGAFPIADKLRLLPGGRIDGHVHPNETSWRVRDAVLEFLGPGGAPTTRFETIQVDHDGIHLRGDYLGTPPTVHRLDERAAAWHLGGDYAAWLPLER